MKIREKIRRFCPEPPKQFPTKLKRYSGPIAIVLTVVIFAVPFSLLSANYFFRPSVQPLPVVNVVPSFANSTLTSNWVSKFGTGLSDSATNIIQTNDDGFAVIGTLGNGYAPDNALLVKIDSAGKVLWNQTYPDLSTGIAVVQTSDEGYVIAGNGNGGFILLRTDLKGNTVWNQTYTVSFQGSSGGNALSMIETRDGGYIIVGACTPYLSGEGSNNGFALKTDSSGKVQWSKIYGGSGIDFFRSVTQTGDGNYVLAGYTTSFGAGSFDAWLVEINASGNQVWSKTYGEGPKSSPIQPQPGVAGDEGANSVVQTSAGGFALAGYTYSYGTVGSRSAWLIKTDVSGNVEWSKTYAIEGQSTANALVQTSDGGLAFAGSTSNSTNWGFVDDMWVVKTDSVGNEQWNQAFGGMTGTPDSDVANSLTEASDGGFVLAGSTNPGSTAHGGYFYVVKTLPVSQSQPVAQTFGSVTINADGSIAGTGIQRTGDVYTLTGDISGGISVQKSYIVIDGAGFTVNGGGQYIGVDLGNGVGQDPSRSRICNVTVENLKMINCYYAIGSENTYNNTFIGNYIEGCDTGFWITGSPNNTLIHNTVKNCTTGISINYASGGNIVIENNILSSWSVWLSPDPVVDRNYWGDYTTRFPNAKEIDNSGVWDTPYSHWDKVIDYHPLTDPVDISSNGPSSTLTDQTLNSSPEAPEFSAWATLLFFVIGVALICLVIFKRKGKMN
jgi:parallel beta-helix repeat protein